MMDTCSLSHLFRKITERTLSANNCQATFYLPTTSQSSGVSTPGNLDHANKCQVTCYLPTTFVVSLELQYPETWVRNRKRAGFSIHVGSYTVQNQVATGCGRPSTWNNGAPDPDLLYFFLFLHYSSEQGK